MSRFDEWWEVLPSTRKHGKKPCKEKWAAKKLDEKADEIIEWTRKMARTKSWRDGFNPAPSTIINQERWLDGDPVEKEKFDRAKGPVNQAVKPDELLAYIIKNVPTTVNQRGMLWEWIQSQEGSISGVIVPDDPETGAPGFRFMASEMLSEAV